MRFAYLILAHDAFDQLARLAVRLLTGARRRLRWTQCSDEHVVQTGLVNSRFVDRIAGNRRFILWREGAWSPQVLTRSDAPDRANEWFGRKFDAGVDDFFYAL